MLVINACLVTKIAWATEPSKVCIFYLTFATTWDHCPSRCTSPAHVLYISWLAQGPQRKSICAETRKQRNSIYMCLHAMLQDFSFENSTASVRAYASYSDGYANDVTDLPGLSVTSMPAAPLNVTDIVGNITVSTLCCMPWQAMCTASLVPSLASVSCCRFPGNVVNMFACCLCCTVHSLLVSMVMLTRSH